MRTHLIRWQLMPAVAEAFSASGGEIQYRHVRIQILHGLQLCYALRLIRVGSARPIHRLTGSVTQPPAVPLSTVTHVPEQDEPMGVVGQSAPPPHRTQLANFFFRRTIP